MDLVKGQFKFNIAQVPHNDCGYPRSKILSSAREKKQSDKGGVHFNDEQTKQIHLLPFHIYIFI